ncbi:MAG: DUF3788 domain-containing protein [Christensenellales bacterium]
MDLIQDRGNSPDMQSIHEYISGPASTRWHHLITHIEKNYSSKPQLSYSVCMAKPGWNVKYKKSGKSICTIYPEKEGFVVLIVLGSNEMALFDANRSDFTQYTNNLFDRCSLFNNTKWLMANVTGDDILKDVFHLLRLKFISSS